MSDNKQEEITENFDNNQYEEGSGATESHSNYIPGSYKSIIDMLMQ